MTPNFSRAEVEAHQARKARASVQPVKGPNELLAVFVPGRLVNPLNASAWGWQKRSRTAKAWKERTAAAIFEAEEGNRSVVYSLPFAKRMEAAGPKRVAFTARVFNRFDSDGLQASLKPVRDALVDCGVISGDADRDGHRFTYEQVIDRQNRGVTIRVALVGP